MKKLLMTCIICAIGVLTTVAQDKDEANTTAQANNPLAKMTAFSIQNYYGPKLTDAPDNAYLNTAWLYLAKPVANGKILIRASAPIQTIGTPDGTGSVQSYNGLGDIGAFASYSFISKPTATVGIGPMITAPTATRDMFGTGKWQGGLAMIAFIAQSPQFQFGGLVTWQASFAGDDDRSDTSVGAIQPFLFFQLGKGTYLRSAPIWSIDFKTDDYSIPVSAGIGKIIKINKSMFNFYLEPQYAILHSGTRAQFQLLTGLNIQIL